MPFKMIFEVDGGCRNNGRRSAYGAAVAVQTYKNGQTCKWWAKKLPPARSFRRPTNQRAEIAAIILALEEARAQFRVMPSQNELELTIYSDSKYAINCMNNWIYKWSANGWKNSMGNPVVNRDLIQRASKLDDEVEEWGTVEYKYLPREDNFLADSFCNEVMDNM